MLINLNLLKYKIQALKICQAIKALFFLFQTLKFKLIVHFLPKFNHLILVLFYIQIILKY